VSEFVNALKTNTARLLRRDFPKELARWYKQPVLWSRSYCAISVGGAPLDVLKRYIEQQDGAPRRGGTLAKGRTSPQIRRRRRRRARAGPCVSPRN
jgi:hypothetical protein